MKMMEICDRIKKNLALGMQAQTDILTRGGASDHAMYSKIVGKIKGMQDAMDIVDQTFTKVLDEGDADGQEGG